jgi:hypothetical protein
VRVLYVVALLTACGRINFDPPGGGGTVEGATDGRPGDGVGGDGAGSGGALGDRCTNPRSISIGDVILAESIADAADDYPSTGCGSGPDVVYEFQQPATMNRTVSIGGGFTGSFAVTTTCPPTPSTCRQFAADYTYVNDTQNLPAGPVYIVIEKTGGIGTDFMITVL